MFSRRDFLKFFGVATVGATVAYSFPSIIVPQNIDAINLVIRREIYPELIRDFWFQESAFFAKLNNLYIAAIDSCEEPNLVIVSKNSIGLLNSL